MAFSYSDKNFTVIGNLCFVHIILDGTKDFYEIPPAIVDRMSSNVIVSVYPDSSGDTASLSVGFAVINAGRIFCTQKGNGYLSFFFPIDSNK